MLVLLVVAISAGRAQARPEPWWLPDPLGLFNSQSNNNASVPSRQVRSGYTCEENDFDEPQYCLCNPGQKISRFKSRHDNGPEDRKWSLECAPISDAKTPYVVSDTSEWYFRSRTNDLDEVFDWDGRSCSGGDTCCTKENQCYLGEGDCDFDEDCRGNLVCGENSCLGHQGFDDDDDCCVLPPGSCDGGDDCCSSSRQCNVGEGDCDDDSDCAGNLKCGQDNCIGWEDQDDCCYDPDHPVVYNNANAFLVGMESVHNNHNEDRKYTLFYARSDNWVLSKCGDLMKLNNLDQPVDLKLGADEVIARVHSEHDNGAEDREFSIVVCRLVKKCGELIKIEYDMEHAKETKKDGVFAGESIYNNTNSKSQNSVTAEIEVNEQKTLSDSYSYEHTSGYTNEASLSVTAGYNWGVLGNGGNLAVTAGFSHTWSTSETWSRSNSKEFSEGNSRKTSYTANCAPGCFCKLEVHVTVGQSEIPYTMTSKSKGVDGAVCIEQGVMKSVRTWNAQAISTDTGC